MNYSELPTISILFFRRIVNMILVLLNLDATSILEQTMESLIQIRMISQLKPSRISSQFSEQLLLLSQFSLLLLPQFLLLLVVLVL